MVWNGMAWHGMVWSGRVGFGRVFYDMAILLLVPIALSGTLTRNNERNQPMYHKV